MPRSKVRLDLSPLRRFKTQVAADLRGTGNGPIAEAIQRRWVDRYLLYLRNRFRRNAAGGGDWPALAESTLRQGGPRRGILTVTGAIFGALFRGRAGNLILRVRNGVRVGIGGPARHPDSDQTIGQISAFHQSGTDKVPARPIIWPPDEPTKAGMQGDIGRGFKETLQRLPKPKP